MSARRSTQAVETVLAASLVLDYNLYPRHQTDAANVSRIVESLRAGFALPPVVADRASRRVVDGFHRIQAALKVGGEGAEIAVEWQDYDSDAAILLDAGARQASHGLQLSSYDMARFAILAEEFHITRDVVAEALHITRDKLDWLHIKKVGFTKDGEPVELKRTVVHLAQTELTPKQLEAQKRAGGMSPKFYVRQLQSLIDGDLLPDDPTLDEELTGLRNTIDRYLAGRQVLA